MTEIPIIYKPVYWFTEQNIGLVSIYMMGASVMKELMICSEAVALICSAKTITGLFLRIYFWAKVISGSYLISFYLTHFMPLVSFYTPWKHHKTKGFLGVLKETNGMKWVNTKKATFSLFHKPTQRDNQPFVLPTLKINDNVFERVQSIKFLSLLLDKYLPWNKCIRYKTKHLKVSVYCKRKSHFWIKNLQTAIITPTFAHTSITQI